MDINTDILCIGNATVDVFIVLDNKDKINFDKFSNQISFSLGEKIPLDKYIYSLGGNACNVSVGLSRLGFTTSLSTEIGTDDFSEIILSRLKSENVDTRFISKEFRSAPLFNLVLTYGGERTILDASGDEDFNTQIPTLNPRLVYLSSGHGDWQETYSKSFSTYKNALFAINPSSKQINDSSHYINNFFKNIDILFLNVSEAQNIIQDSNPDIKVILKKIKDLGPENVIITDGINGSYSIDKSGNIFQIGVLNSEKPIERTGAGDSYASGFIYGFLNGKSIEECMKLGTINADSVIMKFGAQSGLLQKDSMENSIKKYNDFNAFKI